MNDTQPAFWVLSEIEAYETSDTFRGFFSTLELAQAAADKLVLMKGRGGWKTEPYRVRWTKVPAGQWIKLVCKDKPPMYMRDAAGDFRYWLQLVTPDQLSIDDGWDGWKVELDAAPE